MYVRINCFFLCIDNCGFDMQYESAIFDLRFCIFIIFCYIICVVPKTHIYDLKNEELN